MGRVEVPERRWLVEDAQIEKERRDRALEIYQRENQVLVKRTLKCAAGWCRRRRSLEHKPRSGLCPCWHQYRPPSRSPFSSTHFSPPRKRQMEAASPPKAPSRRASSTRSQRIAAEIREVEEDESTRESTTKETGERAWLDSVKARDYERSSSSDDEDPAEEVRDAARRGPTRPVDVCTLVERAPCYATARRGALALPTTASHSPSCVRRSRSPTPAAMSSRPETNSCTKVPRTSCHR